VSAASGRAPRALLLITGDELLRGFIQDANSGYLANELRELGVELERIQIIGDDFDTIRDAVTDARDAAIDLVVLSGGLGPTHDDRTSDAVAAAAGVPLELRADVLEIVESRVRAYGRMRTPEEVATFTPGNRKQATLPRGAEWADPLGTAPGYVLDAGSCVVVVLPGPPSELRHAWRGVLTTAPVRAVVARVGARHERLIRIWGVPESRASQVLAATGHEDTTERRVTICARDGELEIATRGTDVGAVDELVDALRTEFGTSVFAVDDHRPVAALVAALLTQRAWSLATVESCTGGLLGGTLTELAGSSAWYQGGLVTYSNAAKHALAGVDPALIAAHGAVSEEVARAMASGGRAALDADVAIAITGIAGPGGGMEDRPVGTVHLGFATPDGVTHRQIRVPGDRVTVRRRSCHVALHGLRLALEG